MPQTFLLFNFGGNEELAQQARHKVDGWKQGFRLDKKLLLKFDRGDTSEPAEAAAETDQQENSAGKSSRKKPDTAAAKSAKAKEKQAKEKAKEKIQLIIRLDFSDHERLSQQRWLERIPSEAPFKDAEPKLVRHNDPDFADTAERFDSLP
jgi:hypothetical protein